MTSLLFHKGVQTEHEEQQLLRHFHSKHLLLLPLPDVRWLSLYQMPCPELRCPLGLTSCRLPAAVELELELEQQVELQEEEGHWWMLGVLVEVHCGMMMKKNVRHCKIYI
jgi:hypothetical protein